MEVLFHFIFELIKISILASIYTTLLLLVLSVIGRLKPNSLCNSVKQNKTKFWLLGGFIISAGLLVYMFTYWGNHGMGDSAKVPVGHFKEVRQINGTDSYIQNSDGEQLGIENFVFGNSWLYAETQRKFNGGKGDYVVWDLQNDHWTFYKTKADYLMAAGQNNYPMPDRFEEFGDHYKRHWHGWRFWLLP
ncbi:MAG TPA: hypothetical protein DEQ30_01975 [Porphyromonadaceae bacterium]|nr:hypothetical protein [Porphyromonadaceae bacterium]